MEKMKIQSHTPNTLYEQPHFFIQSKGFNAGRPSVNSYSNSYVILANDEVEKGMLFWICFGLWKSNHFIPLLHNSPTTRINIKLTINLIDNAAQQLAEHPELFLSQVKEWKELILTENRLSVQMKLIKLIKKSSAGKMFD